MVKNFLKGLVFGAVTGAAAGLLFAPRSGNETREKLIAELDEATELTNELNNSLNNFKHALSETKKQLKLLFHLFKNQSKKTLKISNSKQNHELHKSKNK